MKTNTTPSRTFRCLPAIALAALGLSQPAARGAPLSYFTSSSATTLQGWHNRVWNGAASVWVDLDPDVTTMPSSINGGAILPTSTGNGLFVPGSGGNSGYVWEGGNTDAHLNTLWLRSPVFYPDGTGNLTVEMAKGITHTTWTAPMNDSAVPYQAGSGTGWVGVALRRVSDSKFVIIKPKTSGNSDTWYTTTFTQAELTPYVGIACTLDLINNNTGGWGWLTMRNVSIPGSFSIPPAHAGTSTVTASPATVASDGVTASTVTVTLKDAGGNPIPGKTVTLASSRGATDTISAASGLSSGSGVVTFTVTSTNAGTSVFTATDTSDSPNVVVTQTATVTFVSDAVSAANSTVTASPTAVAADGSATSTITVTLKDASNSAVIGKTVTLAKTSGPGSPVIAPASATTDGSGVATFTVKSTTAGADVFTATADSVELTVKTVTVTFTAGAVSAGTSTVVAAPATVPADGTATSTVTITLLDATSNPLAGKTVTLASSRLTDDTISAASGVSSVAGVVTFTVKSSTPGSSVITATGDSVALSTTPTVTFTAVSAANSTVTASPATVVANGSTTSTITVTLKDASGNLFAGKAVSLAHTSGPGSPVITTVSGTTNASGGATFTVKSVTAGVDVFTATDVTDSLVITPTATVTFTQPPATMTWGSATNDTLNAGSTAFVETDVKTNGAFVAAVTNGNAGTVNGVTFTRWTSYNTAGTYLITYGTSPITMQWAGNRGDANWGSPSAAYGNFGYDNGTSNKLLLTGGGEGLSPGTITLSSLVAGNTYQVQIWAPTWNNTFNISVGGVNLRAGNPPGTVSQYVVGTFTANAASQTISWSGVAPSAISLRDLTIPTIAAMGSPLSAMSSTYGTASTATSFSVSGSNMAAGITVTPPTGLEVSTTSATTGFAGSGTALTVGSSGTIASTTVYVRLAATAAVSGTYNSQNIVLSSSGATSVNVATAASGNTVSKADQTITFGTLVAKTVGDAPSALTATASSGLAVSYESSAPGVASVDGSTVTSVAAGTTNITASQAGDDNHNAATSVTQALTVMTTAFGTNYNGWVSGSTSLTGAAANPDADPDSDGVTNMMEYALDTNPQDGSSGTNAIAYNGTTGVVTAHGQPIAQDLSSGTGGVDFRAVFGRRKDSGLTYTMQFSADNVHWVNSTATQTNVLATDATIDAVNETYPLFIPVTGGYKKPTFFRVGVSSN